MVNIDITEVELKALLERNYYLSNLAIGKRNSTGNIEESKYETNRDNSYKMKLDKASNQNRSLSKPDNVNIRDTNLLKESLLRSSVTKFKDIFDRKVADRFKSTYVKSDCTPIIRCMSLENGVDTFEKLDKDTKRKQTIFGDMKSKSFSDLDNGLVAKRQDSWEVIGSMEHINNLVASDEKGSALAQTCNKEVKEKSLIELVKNKLTDPGQSLGREEEKKKLGEMKSKSLCKADVGTGLVSSRRNSFEAFDMMDKSNKFGSKVKGNSINELTRSKLISGPRNTFDAEEKKNRRRVRDFKSRSFCAADVSAGLVSRRKDSWEILDSVEKTGKVERNNEKPYKNNNLSSSDTTNEIKERGKSSIIPTKSKFLEGFNEAKNIGENQKQVKRGDIKSESVYSVYIESTSTKTDSTDVSDTVEKPNKFGNNGKGDNLNDHPLCTNPGISKDKGNRRTSLVEYTKSQLVAGPRQTYDIEGKKSRRELRDRKSRSFCVADVSAGLVSRRKGSWEVLDAKEKRNEIESKCEKDNKNTSSLAPHAGNKDIATRRKSLIESTKSQLVAGPRLTYDIEERKTRRELRDRKSRSFCAADVGVGLVAKRKEIFGLFEQSKNTEKKAVIEHHGPLKLAYVNNDIEGKNESMAVSSPCSQVTLRPKNHHRKERPKSFCFGTKYSTLTDSIERKDARDEFEEATDPPQIAIKNDNSACRNLITTDGNQSKSNPNQVTLRANRPRIKKERPNSFCLGVHESNKAHLSNVLKDKSNSEEDLARIASLPVLDRKDKKRRLPIKKKRNSISYRNEPNYEKKSVIPEEPSEIHSVNKEYVGENYNCELKNHNVHKNIRNPVNDDDSEPCMVTDSEKESQKNDYLIANQSSISRFSDKNSSNSDVDLARIATIAALDKNTVKKKLPIKKKKKSPNQESVTSSPVTSILVDGQDFTKKYNGNELVADNTSLEINPPVKLRPKVNLLRNERPKSMDFTLGLRTLETTTLQSSYLSEQLPKIDSCSELDLSRIASSKALDRNSKTRLTLKKKKKKINCDDKNASEGDSTCTSDPYRVNKNPDCHKISNDSGRSEVNGNVNLSNGTTIDVSTLTALVTSQDSTDPARPINVDSNPSCNDAPSSIVCKTVNDITDGSLNESMPKLRLIPKHMRKERPRSMDFTIGMNAMEQKILKSSYLSNDLSQNESSIESDLTRIASTEAVNTNVKKCLPLKKKKMKKINPDIKNKNLNHGKSLTSDKTHHEHSVLITDKIPATLNHLNGRGSANVDSKNIEDNCKLPNGATDKSHTINPATSSDLNPDVGCINTSSIITQKTTIIVTDYSSNEEISKVKLRPKIKQLSDERPKSMDFSLGLKSIEQEILKSSYLSKSLSNDESSLELDLSRIASTEALDRNSKKRLSLRKKKKKKISSDGDNLVNQDKIINYDKQAQDVNLPRDDIMNNKNFPKTKKKENSSECSALKHSTKSVLDNTKNETRAAELEPVQSDACNIGESKLDDNKCKKTSGKTSEQNNRTYSIKNEKNSTKDVVIDCECDRKGNQTNNNWNKKQIDKNISENSMKSGSIVESTDIIRSHIGDNNGENILVNGNCRIKNELALDKVKCDNDNVMQNGNLHRTSTMEDAVVNSTDNSEMKSIPNIDTKNVTSHNKEDGKYKTSSKNNGITRNRKTSQGKSSVKEIQHFFDQQISNEMPSVVRRKKDNYFLPIRPKSMDLSFLREDKSFSYLSDIGRDDLKVTDL